jgi:molybdopterin synthase catalytic subunit
MFALEYKPSVWHHRAGLRPIPAMTVHCGQAVAEYMNARQVPVDNIRPILPFQKHETLENDHKWAHIQALANKICR